MTVVPSFEEQVSAAQGLSCLPRFQQGEFQWFHDGLREVMELAAEADITLHRWQVHALAAALAVDDDGGWLHHTVGILVPRQAGKTLLAHLRGALGLLRGEAVVYMAQDRSMAVDRFKEGIPVFEAIFGERLHVRLATGSERVSLTDAPGVVRVMTPTVNAPRGSTIDCVILDEAYRHDIELQGALEPTLLTKKNPQMWLLSNAGDHDSTLLRHYRDRGRAGATGFAWMEWCAADDADGAEEATWWTCMPSLGEPNGITIERVRAVFETMNPLAWDREMLSRWPLQDHGGGVIDMVAWASRSTSMLVHDDSSLTLGAAVNRARTHGAIAVASVSDGELCIELLQVERGPVTWMADRLLELSEKHGCQVAVDAGGPAGTLAEELNSRGGSVRELGTREYARACAMLKDRIIAGPMSFIETDWLSDAAAVARQRRLSGEMMWAWAEPDFRRQEDYIPITPLEAATVAAFGAVSMPEPRVPRVHLVGSEAV